MTNVHGQRHASLWQGDNGDQSEADFVEPMGKIHYQVFFSALVGVFANIGLQTISQVVVVKSRPHDKVEVVSGVMRVDPPEDINVGVRVDVQIDHTVGTESLVRLNFKVDKVASLFKLDEPIETFVIALHVLPIIVLEALQIALEEISFLLGQEVLDIGIVSISLLVLVSDVRRLKRKLDVQVQKPSLSDFHLKDIIGRSLRSNGDSNTVLK